MTAIKLPRLPDRAAVKLTLSVLPELHQMLLDYAVLYREVYGVEEPIQELIPQMLSAFLQGDREFMRSRSARSFSGKDGS